MNHISGTVESITFHNQENGFCVLRVKVPGVRDLATVTAHIASISPGEQLECQGSWTYKAAYGQQFEAKQIKAIPPNTLAGIEKYLGSGLVKGVGPHFAKKLVKHFKASVLDVIEKAPERLLEIEGIGKVRKDRLIAAWDEQKVVREIMIFLQSHGMGALRAARIYKTYGEEAISIIRQNPYRLAIDIHGIGFKTADELGRRLGIDENALIRAEAGVRHRLSEYQSQGHCAAEYHELKTTTSDLLGIAPDVIEQAIGKGVQSGHLIQESIEEKACIFLKPIYLAEQGVAKHIDRLRRGPTPWPPIKKAAAIEWVQRKADIQLSRSQGQAIQSVLSHKLTIITGGPGVGKTTIVRSILQILCRKMPAIMLCAPTGRAAKRLSDTTGFPAKTIHRTLGMDSKRFGFQHNEENPLKVSFIVIDEVSMIDLVLMHHLLKAIPSHAAVLMVGDADQLPSVGAGSVLSDFIQSQVIPVVFLKEIFRQAQTSQIILNAHRVNEGKMPKLDQKAQSLSDFYFVAAQDPETIQRKLIHLISERIPQRFRLHPIHDIQVLTPMNRGLLGTKNLNHCLQSVLNPSKKASLTRLGVTFKVGDKVLQLVNNYDKAVYNGDIGNIIAIDLEQQRVDIQMGDKAVNYEFSELDEITLAYASTIHKSQGSEYPAVVVPIATQHYTMLEKHLLYTAITRGKKLVIVVGQIKALAMAVHNQQSKKRLTKLRERLAQLCYEDGG